MIANAIGPQKTVGAIGMKPSTVEIEKAAPHYAAAIDAQRDRDDASDDFIKKRLHSNIRSALGPDYTPPGIIAIAGARAALVGGLFIPANPFQCLQLAQGGHGPMTARCPLSKEKRTCLPSRPMSAIDPKRTSGARKCIDEAPSSFVVPDLDDRCGPVQTAGPPPQGPDALSSSCKLFCLSALPRFAQASRVEM
jgi:hypothetical protein